MLRFRAKVQQSMSVLKCLLVIFLLVPQFARAEDIATPEWSFEPGDAVGQLAPYPDSEHAEGVLLTGSSQIRLVAPGGSVLSTMQLDLPAAAPAIPVIFRQGEPPRIVAADERGSIYCFRSDSSRLWKYTRESKASDFRLLTAADVEGNGENAVLMSDYRGHLYAVDANGHLRFDVAATNFRISPPATAEIGGRTAVVFGTDDKDIYAVRADGELVWHTEVTNPVGRSLPLVTSLASGQRVVLVGTPFVGAFQGLEALDAVTGNLLWRAPGLLQSYQSTAVADIDGDGTAEILFGDKSNRLYCLDSNGHRRWNVHLDGRGIYSTPAVAELEGKGVIFQVTRGDSVRGKNLYAIDASGNVLDSWSLPGGGAGSPILCRWKSDGALHLLVAGGSGKLMAFRLTQNPGARILWSGLQGEFGMPPGPSSGESRPYVAPAGESLLIGLGTTVVHEPSRGANLITVRVIDPDGTIHLTLAKPETQQTIQREVRAAKPGTYDVRTQWFADSPKPIRTEEGIYDAQPVLPAFALPGKGELAEYLRQRLAAACQLAVSSGNVGDYDAAHAEAHYDQRLMATVDRLRPQGPVMVQVVQNPWMQHHPATLLEGAPITTSGIHVHMLGNEYASAAVALTNVTARPLTLVFRTTLPQAAEFRDVPTVVPDTTGKPQEDPLPLLGRGQTMRLEPAETRELWLTLNSRALDAGKHRADMQIYILERIAPPIPIPLELDVSRVRLPERFTYRHCNWLYLGSIKDERVLDTTIRDAVQHGTNVFNVPGPAITVNCQGAVTGGDTAAADRLIPRLPGAFFLVDGSATPAWSAGCSPSQSMQDTAYSNALHWYANHMQQLGLGHDDYALYIMDEPGLNGGDQRVENYVEAVIHVKAADPQMEVYTNPAGGAWPDVIKPLAGNVDVWCPDLHLFRLYPSELTAVFSKAKHFWHYEAPGDQRGLDPLGYYRMKPWIAFQLGMDGGGYWVYAEKDYWIPSEESEYGVVYPGPNGPVTTKRWEASREGIQDYELLSMLRRAAQASSSPAAKSALSLIDEAVAFVTKGQQNATDISRHFHTYAPDFDTWMSYRARLMAAAEELIR